MDTCHVIAAILVWTAWTNGGKRCFHMNRLVVANNLRKQLSRAYFWTNITCRWFICSRPCVIYPYYRYLISSLLLLLWRTNVETGRGQFSLWEFATTTYSTDQARLRYVTYFIKYATKAELKCMGYATSKKGYNKRQWRGQLQMQVNKSSPLTRCELIK